MPAEENIAAAEFLVVDIGSENVKLGAAITILAVVASLEDAYAKASDVQPRSNYVAILEKRSSSGANPKSTLKRCRITW
jgi:hypothetical protein